MPKRRRSRGAEFEEKVKKHRCASCGFATAYSSALQTHIRRKHTGEKRHKCEHCGFTCVTSSEVQRHIRFKHTGEKRHKCSHCKYASADSGNLQTHIRRKHTGEKRHKCEHCGFTCVTSGDLQRHIRFKHTGEKRHKCEHCDFTCVTSSELRVHIRFKHTGEKRHKCEHCGFTCVTSSDLQSHIRYKHTGEKRHKCEHCGFTCVTSGELQRHLKYKHGNMPRSMCAMPDCGASFVHPDSLLRHLKACHDPKRISQKRKRVQVLSKFLDDMGIQYLREVFIDFKCALKDTNKVRAFIDFVIYTDRGVFLIELDQYQHVGWNYTISCELDRMANVVASTFLAGNEQPVVWVRYNPDSYTVNGSPAKRFQKGQRQHTLLQVLNNYTSKHSVDILYMFYDVVEDEETGVLIPAVFEDPDYEDCMKPLVTEWYYENRVGEYHDIV